MQCPQCDQPMSETSKGLGSYQCPNGHELRVMHMHDLAWTPDTKDEEPETAGASAWGAVAELVRQHYQQDPNTRAFVLFGLMAKDKPADRIWILEISDDEPPLRNGVIAQPFRSTIYPEFKDRVFFIRLRPEDFEKLAREKSPLILSIACLHRVIGGDYRYVDRVLAEIKGTSFREILEASFLTEIPVRMTADS